MRIDGVVQAALPPANQEQQDIKVIDEQQIKSILFLGVIGDMQMEPKSDHSVDTFA